MIDETRMAKVLGLHEQAYALLRWVKESLRAGRLSFSVVHGASNSADAAQEWVGRHRQNIPADARPDQEDLPTFSRLLVSFVTTSFRLNPNAVRPVSSCGCRCPFCSYLQAGPNLDPRTPSKKDFGTALQLKRIYLSRLVNEQNPALAEKAIERVLMRGDLRESLALATWGAELLRRAEFASQGEAVLALWREFAWASGRPKRDFTVTARAICDAERRIRDMLLG